VRIHRRPTVDINWINLSGLPVTCPARIAADLLYDRADPEAVARITADAIRKVYDYPGTFAKILAPFGAQLGLRRDDGYALLRWLLEIVGDPETPRWLAEAREGMGRDTSPAPSASGGIA
jgi:hypothetical protein